MKKTPESVNKITVDGKSYSRLLVKTHVISAGEDIVAVVKKYVESLVMSPNDIVVVSERVVAIAQGRSYPLDKIKVGWWARLLYPLVHNHPGGIGLRSPWTMQLAIDEVGVPRILFAAAVSAVTKPFGLRGMFYRVAGHDINAIDGPCEYSLPPSDNSAKLGPKDPNGVAEQIAEAVGAKAVVIDANDYGVNVMGASGSVNRELVRRLFKDNPMGQADEQTPITVVKRGS